MDTKELFIEALNELDINRELKLEECKFLFLLKFIKQKVDILDFELLLDDKDKKSIEINKNLIKNVILLRKAIAGSIKVKYKGNNIEIKIGPVTNSYYSNNYMLFRVYVECCDDKKYVVDTETKDLHDFMTSNSLNEYMIRNIQNNILNAFDELTFHKSIYKYKYKKNTSNDYRKLLKKCLK